MPGARTYLDDPALAGRIRFSSRRSTYERRAVVSPPHIIRDVRSAPAKPSRPKLVKPTFVRSQPKAVPNRPQRSKVLARQFVGIKKQKRRGLKHMNVRGLALASLAAVLFVFGVGVGLIQLDTNKEVEAQVQTLVVQAEQTSKDGSLPDSGLPSENPSAGGGYWRPAGDEPKRIKIPSLSVNARILKMGVKPNGEIKTPANIFDTGWLETTAKPGEHGAMFLDGHVHGPSKPGVFVGIKRLKAGDKIEIERGDGKVFTYSVVKVETYSKDKVDMVAGLNTAVPGKPGLNLMTCDGRYSTEHGYDHRVMVFAVQD